MYFMSSPNITVAICTWNRANILDKTLEQMRELRVPRGVQWELLVVNNNSPDHTDDVIEKHKEYLPLIRLFERKQGLSNARNCAISAANGELVIWTDDDVLVDPDWVAEYSRAAKSYPNYSFFGGLIKPWFEGTPPSWLVNSWGRVESAYATRDFSDEEFDFSPQRVPFGANYCVRREVQMKYLYDSNLGRTGVSMIGGEEVAVLRAMLSDGHRGRWLPEASVKHFIPRDRQNLSYLRSYYKGQGMMAQSEAGSSNAVSNLFGRPRWLWRAWLQAEMRYRLRRLTSQSSVWIDDFIEASRILGKLQSTPAVEKIQNE